MSQANTNYRTQMPQSQEFQPYHNAPDEPENTNFLQPEEWEDYEDNIGVTSPFHNADPDPHLYHYRSLDSVATTLSTPKSQPLTDSRNNLIPTSPPFSYSSRAQSPTPTTTPSSTNRIMRLQPRGVYHFNPAANKDWLEILQAYLSYTFKDPDILEEALEEPKNGVTRVGRKMRICMDGNEGMSKLGERVIKLVLREQYYLFSIPEASATQITNRILSRTSLYTHPIIASCIRAQPSVPRRWSNLKELIKEDLREDSTRIVSRAVKAVIGAVYLDGGMESAKKVMENLQMGIRLPPASRE